MSPYPALKVSLSDGRDLELQTAFKDLVAAERALHAEGMPSAQEAPLSWSARLAWLSARRTGDIDKSMPYEAFEDQVVSVEVAEKNGHAPEVPPTRKNRGGGSSAK